MNRINTLFRSKSTNSNNDLGKLLQKMNKDSKLIFGPLLETSKMKKKRLKTANQIIYDLKCQNETFLKKIRSNIYLVESSTDNIDMVNNLKPKLLEKNYHSLSLVYDTTREEISKIKFPSVTNVLNATMPEKSKIALEKWKKSMIDKLGEEEFNKYTQEQMMMGTELHKRIRSHFMGDKDFVYNYTEVEKCWKSLESVLQNISKPVVVENMVVHKDLAYKGVVDCIAFHNDTPVVIEWKKSSKPKRSLNYTYDAPIQLAAYIGAVNNDPSYNFKVEEGLVVIAYCNGLPANVFKLTNDKCLKYWSFWIQRLNEFKKSHVNVI
ncbi:mitochondrial genome maintenance exonuclease 1 isoform X3 [Daktulosphaira vitifoliae]|nr:mitochondrial genome maintenance exonuclease 1 isoform X3 [Daktulosphaira vitifoliae]